MSTIPVRDEALQEMGPVDYIVIEWPGRQPHGEAMPHLVDLVDRGIVRIIDLAFVTKDEHGNTTTLGFSDVERDSGFGEILSAATGILGDDDLDEAAEVLEPGTSAAVLVFENRWAAPFATAVRRNGGQLVASGRIPVQSLAAALDAVEAHD